MIGSIMMMTFSISESSMMTTGWSTPPGKFLSAIAEADVSFAFWASIIFIVLGCVILTIEYLKKE